MPSEELERANGADGIEAANAGTGNADPLANLDRTAEELATPPTIADLIKDDGITITTFAEAYHHQPPSPDPIVDGLFEAGDKVELIGPSKVRKSWFTMGLAAHVAAGRDFCGWRIPRPRRVVYFNLEIKEDWFARRLWFLKNYGLDPDGIGDRLTVVNVRGHARKVRDTLAAFPKGTGIDLIVVDPRYKMMVEDEDDNNAADLRALLDTFDHAAGNGPAILVVSHDGKGDAGARDIRDRGAGSSVASRDCDARIVLTPHAQDPDNMLTVDTLARNFAPKPSFSVVFDGDTRTFRDIDAPPIRVTERNAGSAANVVRLAVLDRLAKSGATTPELVADVGRSTGYKERTIKGVLSTLATSGEIVKTQGPTASSPTTYTLGKARPASSVTPCANEIDYSAVEFDA